jgi:hypothetical protein
MPLQRSSWLAAALVLSLFGTAAAQEDSERSITQADLPPAVAKAVLAESQGATLRGLSEEHENGQTFYEAELVVSGHSRDVLFDSTGAVVEVEEEVALPALPEKVRSALEAKAGKGTITRVESLSRQGHIVAYEAHVTTAGKRSEIQVGPEGEKLAHEE